ncbi:MAG: hypothetical protein COB40_00065 [Marinosulfonomonas sp.]|nr:MAG: hypothetical protein COB40_00065 [Marinosulfonomonas sp.]
MFKRVVTSALIFGAAALAPPANAQQHTKCLDRDTMVQILETRYNETLSSVGLQGSSQLLEIWRSEASGSFTVLITNPEGTSCIVASGQNWLTFESIEKVGIAS